MGEFSLDRFYTKEEYLAILKESEVKYEYVDGVLVNMSGGTINHNRISGNIFNSISNRINGLTSGCEAFGSDQKVAIPTKNAYFFPDVSAVCPPIEVDTTDQDAITNPVLIVEVFSKSTRQYDAGGKFNYYQSIPSLREFILVEQNAVSLSLYRRTDDNAWRIFPMTDSEQSIEIASLGIAIPIQEIYRNVSLE